MDIRTQNRKIPTSYVKYEYLNCIRNVFLCAKSHNYCCCIILLLVTSARRRLVSGVIGTTAIVVGGLHKAVGIRRPLERADGIDWRNCNSEYKWPVRKRRAVSRCREGGQNLHPFALY